jgi:hypothetical protein
MTQEEALNIIKKACSAVVTTLPIHQNIQLAIQTIEKLLTEEEAVDE